MQNIVFLKVIISGLTEFSLNTGESEMSDDKVNRISAPASELDSDEGEQALSSIVHCA
jgi:hypothetical protein